MLLAKNSRINLFIATVMQKNEKNKGEVRKKPSIFTDGGKIKVNNKNIKLAEIN